MQNFEKSCLGQKISSIATRFDVGISMVDTKLPVKSGPFNLNCSQNMNFGKFTHFLQNNRKEKKTKMNPEP